MIEGPSMIVFELRNLAEPPSKDQDLLLEGADISPSLRVRRASGGFLSHPKKKL